MTQNNMNKKHAYAKPSMKVYQLQQRTQILMGSQTVPIDSSSSSYQW